MINQSGYKSVCNTDYFLLFLLLSTLTVVVTIDLVVLCYLAPTHSSTTHHRYTVGLKEQETTKVLTVVTCYS